MAPVQQTLVPDTFRLIDSERDVRQVNEAELVWTVKYALGRVGKQRLKGLLSSEHTERRFAVQMVAEELVQALGNYEVLSEAPLPEQDLFTAAAFRDR